MARVGKGGRKPTKASAAIRGAQASDPSRFAAGAEGIEAGFRITDETATVRCGEASATFEGPAAGDRAREWLKKAERDYPAAQNGPGSNH